MSNTDITYSFDVVKDLSDAELYQRLFECWGITNGKIEVWGELTTNAEGNWAGIKKSRMTSDSQYIEYPLVGKRDLQSGAFLSPLIAKGILGEDKSAMISCELSLASSSLRNKKNNPFLLAVKGETIERLVELPLIDKEDLLGSEGGTLLRETLYSLQLKLLKDDLEHEARLLAQSLDTKKLNINSEIKQLDESLNSHAEKLEQTRLKAESLQSRNLELESTNFAINRAVAEKQAELTSLLDQYKQTEIEMAKKIEKLKSYISEKAVFLKDFEFIDEDDFDSFIFEVTKSRGTEDMISFSGILDGDYKQAVSYIQAYLEKQHILYPRHIIENYLTLIRSNDLIILAGDSGSGKTSLVQSFAKAVGGVSKIIPVKPNWTSSEDLLGYYNPLEKKYLATPFLEALIEAQQNPEVPYFICLDEMNLARVEYYFADFLSKLEDRENTPEIQLYSDDESAHVLSELKAVVAIISGAREKYSQDGLVDFVKLMQDEAVNTEMKRAFGFSDKDSLIKYHGDIRRMLVGIISTPSTIKIPANVRIIGAINIDETTHYLSPKILDRAHIMKFKSPLLTDWDEIFAEIDTYDFDDVSKPLFMEVEELGERAPYPSFKRDDDFCQLFVELNKEFFSPLDVEFGMRTIRQGLNYLELFSELNSSHEQAINNFIIHKVLPKFTFDGNKQSGNFNKLDLLEKVLLPKLEELITEHESVSSEFSSVEGLRAIIENAKSNDGVVNYWA
ncbi:AAA family ATPase [uncultured Shewanella sp.]|uniref:McrB family protein n=1 Tax=uncultured Shewanella sp. TaxID=173975 RepID=UPI0026307845|nr:AAA family ATPase [uncultured Shewanella sp.]